MRRWRRMRGRVSERIGKRMHAGNPKRPYPWATVVGVVARHQGRGPAINRAKTSFTSPRSRPTRSMARPSREAVPRRRADTSRCARRCRRSRWSRCCARPSPEVDPLLPLQQVQPMDGGHLQRGGAAEVQHRSDHRLCRRGAYCWPLPEFMRWWRSQFRCGRRRLRFGWRWARSASGIARLVLVSGAKLALLGCGLGLVGSVAVSRVVSSFLVRCERDRSAGLCSGRSWR